MTIELRIKNIETQEVLIAELESLEDAKAWVAERPHMIEVLGVVDPRAVGEAAFEELRAAVRPLDDDERESRHRAAEERLARMREADVRESAPRRAEPQPMVSTEPNPDPATLPDAEPNALMTIRWRKGAPMANIADNRPITPAARAAVDAWIAERNEWLHPKRSHVGEAELYVWPGELPEPETDRVQDGARYNQLPGWADD